MIERRETGFSLLEVLVAVGIVTVGVTSVLALFAAGVDVHKQAVDQSNAALAVESIASELEGRYTIAAIDAWIRAENAKGRRNVDERDYLAAIGPAEPVEIPGFPGYRYDVKFTPLDESGFAVMAEIRVYWRKGGGRGVIESAPKVLLKRPY